MSPEPDPLADPQEQKVLYAALDSFRQYRKAAHYNITHLRRQAFYSLPSAHADILCEPPFSLPDIFLKVDDAIDANAQVAENILQTGLAGFGLKPEEHKWRDTASPSDVDKARSTIRQFYRDWSLEGQVERQACFRPIQAALEQYFPASYEERGDIRVLVPGAGLGRLVFDLCLAGYTVEGNEISYHQLIASNYLLNHTTVAQQHTLYPWALGFSNHLTRNNQLRSVTIPDIHPGTAVQLAANKHPAARPHSERMSMSAGDFAVVYRQPDSAESFDAVTTCFFIDTAPNLIHYIEAVRSCLKPNGVWINLGPLLWHFESAPTPAEKERERQQADGDASISNNVSEHGIGDPGSFELSNDEVIDLLVRLGFKVEESKESTPSGYIQDPQSLLQNVYRPVFWVARKSASP